MLPPFPDFFIFWGLIEYIVEKRCQWGFMPKKLSHKVKKLASKVMALGTRW